MGLEIFTGIPRNLIFMFFLSTINFAFIKQQSIFFVVILYRNPWHTIKIVYKRPLSVTFHSRTGVFFYTKRLPHKAYFVSMHFGKPKVLWGVSRAFYKMHEHTLANCFKELDRLLHTAWQDLVLGLSCFSKSSDLEGWNHRVLALQRSQTDVNSSLWSRHSAISGKKLKNAHSIRIFKLLFHFWMFIFTGIFWLQYFHVSCALHQRGLAHRLISGLHAQTVRGRFCH